MANGKTIKTRDDAALAATSEDEELSLAFEQIGRHMDNMIANLKILKWMAFFTLAVMVFLLLYYLYSIFEIMGYF